MNKYNILKFIENCTGTKFIFLLSVLFSIFIIFYMIFTGNANETYYDYILEITSKVSANKSAEVFLLYFLSVTGIFLYCIFYYFAKYKTKNDVNFPKAINTSKIVLLMVGTIVLFQNLIIFKFSIIIVALFLYLLILYNNDKQDLINGVVFFFANLYSVYALHRIMLFFGLYFPLNEVMSVITAFVISIIPIIINHSKEKIVSKIILIEQFILPGLLLIYLADKYKFKDEIVQIDVLIQIKILITALILVMIAEAIYLIKKNWDKEVDLNKIIAIGSCISIMGYNLCGYIGSIVPSDMHHPYENIIGFTQIFLSKLFSQYIPVSGMYSIIQGAFFDFFGNGYISQYWITKDIFYLFISILTIFLIKFHVNRKLMFIFSVIFLIIYYNRVAFILPIMLLLSLPQLLNNKNLWLKIWILTSLFHGLYYPLFGTAVCFAYFPLAIFQIVTYTKSDLFLKEIKTFKFWFNWVLCLLPVVLSSKLLVGTYLHIKAMSEQTIWADGIARFGQAFGKAMFPYLADRVFYKLIIVYILTFLLPALFVIVAIALALRYFNIRKDCKINSENIKQGCLALSLVILPFISYSYTIVRIEIGNIYSRHMGVILAGCVLFIIYVLNYSKDKELRCKIICFSLIVMMFVLNWGFCDNEKKLVQFMNVPKDYLLIKDDTSYKIGTGFIEKKTYSYIKNFEGIDRAERYFALPNYGIYYIYDIKGAAVLETWTTKSYKAVKETVDNIVRNKAIVSYYYTFENYYLHNWLLTSGKYVWNKEKKLFYFNNGTYSKSDVKRINSEFDMNKENLDLRLHSSSLGLSMKSLMHIFSIPHIKYDFKKEGNTLKIVFNAPLIGDDADFVYIEFDNMRKNIKYATYEKGSVIHNVEKNYIIAKYFLKKNYNPGMDVKLKWTDNFGINHSLTANMGQGKLLIPLGAGNKWLLNSHQYLDISVLVNKKITKLPEVKEVKFLKLRKIN